MIDNDRRVPKSYQSHGVLLPVLSPRLISLRGIDCLEGPAMVLMCKVPVRYLTWYAAVGGSSASTALEEAVLGLKTAKAQVPPDGK